ncbi:hypothetical protein D1J51_02700 [Leucobacter sp. wl10]|nr:hypothetical protein D1J51_02700 [Leucobacter sp. wl10]
MNSLRNFTRQAIRVALAVEGKNQVWLAKRLPISPSSFTRRMTGAACFEIEELVQIANVFSIDAPAQLTVSLRLFASMHRSGRDLSARKEKGGEQAY